MYTATASMLPVMGGRDEMSADLIMIVSVATIVGAIATVLALFKMSGSKSVTKQNAIGKNIIQVGRDYIAPDKSKTKE